MSYRVVFSGLRITNYKTKQSCKTMRTTLNTEKHGLKVLA